MTTFGINSTPKRIAWRPSTALGSMIVKIELLPQAKEDLIRQFRYYLLNADHAATAFRFRAAVRASLDALRPNPLLGSPIVCKAEQDVLQVLRILHGKRNVRRILSTEATQQ